MGCALGRYAVEDSYAYLDLRDLTIKVARLGGGWASQLILRSKLSFRNSLGRDR